MLVLIAASRYAISATPEARLTHDVSPDVAEHRAQFLKIEKRLYAYSYAELDAALAKMENYPLAPYLLADKLVDRLRINKAQKVRKFLETYSDTPLERRVRKPWLEYLLKRGRYDLFVDFYRSGFDADIQCHYLRHYDADRSSATHKEKVADLWNVGNSQPRACDPLFKQWMDDGGLDESLILQRIEKAADGGSHTLIPYLTGLLGDDKKYLAKLWHDVRKNPAKVKSLKRFNGRYPMIEADIISYALKRLIWRDPDAAIITFKKAKSQLTFPKADIEEISSSFAIALALNKDPRAERWLNQVLELKPTEDTLHWHLAFLIRQNQWHKIKLLIEKIPPQLSNNLQFQYWYARAHEHVGEVATAKVLYADLANERHYYGFLASARLDLEPTLAHQPVATSNDKINKILNSDFAKRAYEFRKLGRDYRARREWMFLQRDLTDEELLASAKISSSWGWHDQTIRTLGKLREFNDVELRFPIAFPELLVAEAKKNNLQPSWSLAIARRESSFMPDAISTANARGLMQVLPSTARFIEKRRFSSKDLLKPEISASLGNKYLRYLLDKFNDNLLATASYNAGWRKVTEWLPEQQAMDAEVWIELIPYRETRNYVKAVLAYQQIYQTKLATPDEMQVFANLVASRVDPKT